jgi:RNase P/RNase MRP subunit POP5
MQQLNFTHEMDTEDHIAFDASSEDEENELEEVNNDAAEDSDDAMEETDASPVELPASPSANGHHPAKRQKTSEPIRRFATTKPTRSYLRLRLFYPNSPATLPTTAFFKKALVGAVQTTFGMLNAGVDMDLLSLSSVKEGEMEAVLRVPTDAMGQINAALTLLTKIEGRDVRCDCVDRGGYLAGMGQGVDSRTWAA